MRPRPLNQNLNKDPPTQTTPREVWTVVGKLGEEKVLCSRRGGDVGSKEGQERSTDWETTQSQIQQTIVLNRLKFI